LSTTRDLNPEHVKVSERVRAHALVDQAHCINTTLPTNT